ncbi:ubiquinone/menaquinone biosynthesis C-methylase UbiE [Haloactinopolyspora alba]|uniref:Ubiquinone/menaquinone biosynthesis C-methylase UbiE n=1 Tax=Haloactinopolyspora alba TaxID=648780 RepID=A0A2P8DX65_9ACTN|nr:class I SAM-dependent methyltransferase [Haloactinopolyspora alba]PSL01804.1 ubiquinone/menaquinone biosynthesis C-methylase UbiE [Haloactinopolyspora alba]
MTATDLAPEQSPLDQEKVEAFAGRMLTTFTDACAALMISIGHQTGLFDVLAGTGPATSEQIARAAGVNERYVREWLGAMTTAKIVDHDPDEGTYRLPAEHAASLTRAAGPDNLATLTQMVSMLGEVEPAIVECFRNGGGLPYSAYPRFHRLMAENSAQVFDASLLDVTLPMAPGVADRLRAGADVLDIGCGQGHAINLLAQEFPASRFTGYDFSDEAIGHAREEAGALGLTNATFDVVDVATMTDADSYDLVTAFDSVHDQADPAGVLAAVARALRPGGTFLMVDIKASSNVADNVDSPLGTFFYTVSTLHCMSVSLGLDGAGLGTAWGRQLAESMLHDAGFTDVAVGEIEADILNYYYVARKG